MGNSEVGHLNLGAGRVVPQDLVRISQSIQSGEFYQIEPLVELCAGAAADAAAPSTWSACSGPAGCTPSTGTCSPAWSWGSATGSPPSPSTAFSTAATRRPPSAPRWCARCCMDMRRIAGSQGGRRHADRPLLRDGPRPPLGPDQAGLRRDGPRRRARRWSIRCSRCRPPTSGARPTSSSSPLVHVRNGVPVAHDAGRRRGALLQLPQRPDAADRERARHRRLRGVRRRRPARALLRHHDPVRPDLSHAPGVSAVQPGPHPGARSWRNSGRTQFRTAETEKYPHVTYFFNGGYEPPYPGEERCLIPSQRVATYDLAPEMSARGHHRRALPHHRGRDGTTSCSATTPTRTWWGTPACCRRSSGRWRRWTAAWSGCCASADKAGSQRPHHRRPRQLRDDDRSRRPAACTRPTPPTRCRSWPIGAGRATLRAGGSLRDVAPTVLRLLGHRATRRDDRTRPEGLLSG